MHAPGRSAVSSKPCSLPIQVSSSCIERKNRTDRILAEPPTSSFARRVPGRFQARSLLKEAEGNKKLSKAEAKELENDLRHDINTQFGTRNENFALDVYERRSGTEVGYFFAFLGGEG